MLVFGHTGITLGAAVLMANLLPGSRLSKATGNEAISPPTYSTSKAKAAGDPPIHKTSWFTSLGKYVDIRLILIGSLLPDIIDKPVGMVFLRESLSNGRIYCHTLLFLIIITLGGLYLYRSRGRTSLLAVSFGVLTHLILDQMWRTPRTLFWPIYGLTFGRVEITDWIPNIINALLTDPTTYLPELVGAVILVWFAGILIRRKKVLYFLRYGKVE